MTVIDLICFKESLTICLIHTSSIAHCWWKWSLWFLCYSLHVIPMPHWAYSFRERGYCQERGEFLTSFFHFSWVHRFQWARGLECLICLNNQAGKCCRFIAGIDVHMQWTILHNWCCYCEITVHNFDRFVLTGWNTNSPTEAPQATGSAA